MFCAELAADRPGTDHRCGVRVRRNCVFMIHYESSRIFGEPVKSQGCGKPGKVKASQKSSPELHC